MAAASTDYFTEVGSPGTATTLAAPGHSIGGSSFTVVSTSNWPTNTGVIFAVDNYTLQTVNGVPNTAVRTAGTYTEWEGVVASSTSITGAVLRYGTDQNYSAGSLTRVYIPVASSRENRLAQGIQVEHNQNGTHAAVTATSVTASGSITAANFIQTGGSAANGWTVGLPAPNTVTYNGNRSYDLVFNSTDYTGTLSNGMRLRTTRTVAAPTQCTSLNGTTQFYSKTSPAGMTFTDDFVAGAWIKLTSYTNAGIVSRFNGTSGWILSLNASGQPTLYGANAGGANFSQVVAYQSVPLNKWVHITAQLDMSSFTATPTTSYIMIDGVDVPASVGRGGTNPTALIQAGNLEIGSYNAGTNFFPGKIAQAFVTSAKVTQATIRSNYYSQSISPTETSLISAYSFNNSTNDLNANANNLTANGSAVATNADSPFTQDDTGTPSGTNDFAIITKKVFSTNTTITVQVPEGCTIPTSGGVSSVVYSSNKVPFGFPASRGKWQLEALYKATASQATPAQTNTTYYNLNSAQISIPLGEWTASYVWSLNGTAASGNSSIVSSFSTSPTTNSDDSFYSETLSASLNTENHLTGYGNISQSTQSPRYMISGTLNGLTSLQNNQNGGRSKITLECAYL